MVHALDKVMKMKLNAKATLMILLGMVATIVIADLAIDALTPIRTAAFDRRLVANVCIVIIFVTIWYKKVWLQKGVKRKRSIWGLCGMFDIRSAYLWGIGVGLMISWVTSAIAYLRGPHSAAVQFELILLELILNVIFILVAHLINTKRGKAGKS